MVLGMPVVGRALRALHGWCRVYLRLVGLDQS
jgi:hypothetical protein